MNTINFVQNNVPVTYDLDVLVVGGGLGGIAAAIAAARAGAKVALIERNAYLGGVATAGMCCSVYNCMCTDSGKLAIDGIPYEVVEALACHAGGPGDSWLKHRGHIIYDVEQAKLVLAEMIVEAGVIFLPSMIACSVIKDGNRLKGVIASGRNGLEAIMAKNIVDSTGDSDVAFLAGVPINIKLDKQSYVFRLGGVNMDAFVNYFRENPDQYPSKMDVNWSVEDALAQYDENETFLFPHGGGFQNEIVRKAVEDGLLKTELGSHNNLCATQMHGTKKTGSLHVITGYTDIKGMDSGSLGNAILDGRRMANHMLTFFKERMPGFENAYISATSDDLGIRQSRTIINRCEFTKNMKESAYRCEDAVGVGVVESFKVLNDGKDAWTAQVLTDDMYEISLNCMLPSEIEGLVMGAGRSITPYLRVMVVTMIVGQGAGTAAAIASKNNIPVSEVDCKAVRLELEKRGVSFPKQ